MKKTNHAPASERTIAEIREGLRQVVFHTSEASIRQVIVAATAKPIPENTPVRTTILHVFFNRKPEKSERLAEKYIA